MQGINIDALEHYLASIVSHYDKSSPAVSNYVDDLYIRLRENTQQITLFELMRISQLYDVESETWMNPNLAQNHTYKTLDILGRDTVGMIDF